MKNRKKQILCMLFLISLCFLPICSVAQTVTKTFKHETLKNVLKEVERQTGLSIIYKVDEVNESQSITETFKKTPIKVVLSKILDNDLEYLIQNRMIIIQKKGSKTTNQKNTSNLIPISGVIFDVDGKPIIGASIRQKGQKVGAISDISGKFNIQVPEDGMLEVTYVGYQNQVIPIKGKHNFNITLRDNSKLLDEIIVVGYGTQRKVNLTGAVAMITSKDIETSHTSSTSTLLAGRIPGVISMTTTGFPGQGATVSIRGKSSWNNAPVLYVVDGIEIDKSGFDQINIDEIESISVLKDASAAVYGSRAANGVILVTTKRGKEGKPKFTFSTNLGISSPTNYPKLLNAYQYSTLWNEAESNMGYDKNSETDAHLFYTDEQIENAKTESSNWFNETFMKHSLNQKYNMSINGGSSRIKYFMSLGYLKDEGMYKGIDFERYNLRANIDATINKYLDIRLDIEGVERHMKQPQVSASSLFEYVVRRSPLDKIYNSDGSYYDMGNRHPIAERDHSGYDKNQNNTYRAKLGFNFQIPHINDLKLQALFSYVRGSTHSKSFTIPYSLYLLNEDGSVANERIYGKTALSEEMNMGHNLTTTIKLSYDKTFKDHSLSGLLVYEQYDMLGSTLGASRTNYPFTSIDQIFAGGNDDERENWGSASQDARKGFIGRFNYSYKDRYLAEFSFRYDASLKFHPDHRWGFFPSFSLGWRLSEEKFMKDFKNLDNLKIRASYGVLGNDAVGGWQWTTSYSFDNAYIFNQSAIKTIVSGGIPNINLTWEKTASYNLGIDASFYKGLISFEADIFHKRTYDILGSRNASMPGTFGATLPSENYGVVTVNGFELQLNHNNHIGEFNYHIGGNISWARNKVVQEDYATGIEPWNNPIGKTLGYRACFVALGLFQTNEEAAEWPRFKSTQPTAGDVKYADLNNDGILDERDKKVVSAYNNTPEIMFGINMTANWKGFDLNILFQGAAHRNVMLSGFSTQMFINGNSNLPKYLYDDHWSENNKNARYPKAWGADHPINNKTSTFWLFNGDYIRLKDIELGYSIPKNFLTKLGVERLRLYISGNNLFSLNHLPGYDPEKQDGGLNYYPQQKVFNMGLNITF
jgi:TonB-linked SusC/RagA family outer membrane protein